jgi:serine/threonine protein kinase
MAYVISDKMLGKGSYGNVFLGIKGTKEIAIKCCDMYDNGIENIIETSIMTSLKHPNINPALDIFCTPEKLFIIQELALMDLYTYTNVNKNNHQCSYDELCHIFYSLVQAIVVLHHEQFIHCDIKSNNVLLYANNVIKLTDFTLTVKNLKEDKT